MLFELGIENFVLIKKAVLNFCDGFTVITGETGAGKSLAVQALKLVLGARADTRLVRPGAKHAVIQAMFTPTARMNLLLKEQGIETGDEVIIRRIIPESGKGRIYINGSLVSLMDLKEITGDLVSISGQHEYQTLLRKGSHGMCLDRFADIEHDVGLLSKTYSLLSDRHMQLKRLIEEQQNRTEEEKRLKEEAELIDSVRPAPGEEEEIEQELAVLRSARELRVRGDNVYSMLYACKGALLDILSESSRELERMAMADARLEKALEELQSVRYQTEEIAWQVRDYVQALPTDMARLEQLEERLYALRQLKRRFGPGLDDVIRRREEIEAKLYDASGISENIRRLQTDIQKEGEKLLDMAMTCSQKRRKAATELSQLVKKELADMKLEVTDFVVKVQSPDSPQVQDITPSGFDNVNFLFSANTGQEPAPLDRIASGGELSRVMLALKAVIARKSGIETVLFDELDSGISGEVADRVGQKLRDLSGHGQVIAISHYPQIAAAAMLHINVEKYVVENTTLTKIKKLEDNERIEEITRMLGGGAKDARAWAARLLAPVLRGS